MGCSGSKTNGVIHNSTTYFEQEIEYTYSYSYSQVDNHARQDSNSDSQVDNHARQDRNSDCQVDNHARPDGKSYSQVDNHAEPDGNSYCQSQFDKHARPDGKFYCQVDKHARQAPNSVKGSIADLVNYLSKPSKKQNMLVRAFFVWMSENIKYDVDGFFGGAEMLPCDALSVVTNGTSVCEGYANVMLELCRQANVNAKKIYGYAKGVGHSEDQVITTDEETNHAWNAVKIDGKWYLIDGTWGTGHTNDQNQFEKCFNEFYFLADPEQLINTHFPYMDDNMESSMKWQLLKSPVSLDEFSRSLKRWPESYNFDVQTVSHKQGYIEVNGKFEMTFKIAGKLDVEFTHTLKLYEGGFIKEILNTTFGQRDGDMYRIQICPSKQGKYDFELYGKNVGDEGNFVPLFKYLLKCKNKAETKFRYPEAYSQAQIDRCILHEPLKNNLPPNSQVKVCLSSSFLLRVMINEKFLKKDGNKFEGIAKTGSSGTRMSVFGSRTQDDMLDCLYDFDIK